MLKGLTLAAMRAKWRSTAKISPFCVVRCELMGESLKKIEDRFSAPRQFSFKDGLAVSFVLVYLPMIIASYFGYGEEWAVDQLGRMIQIILGGYFVHEVARMGTDAYQSRRDYRADHRDGPPV